jgi:hypothetical protein
MTQSSDAIFLVTVSAEQLEDDLFLARIAIVQQTGRSYRTVSFDMEERRFPTEAEAIDHGKESVADGLKRQFGKPDIRFNVRESKDKKK